MGRYLHANMCPAAVNKTLRSYCKVRYLMSLLKKYPRPAKAPTALLVLRRCETRKATLNAFSLANCGPPSLRVLRGFPEEVEHARFYSSSNKFKAEAPVGILEEVQNRVQSSFLGESLGQHFHRLSRHVNVYFKRRDMVPLSGTAGLAVTTPEYVGRSQRRLERKQVTAEGNTGETGKDKQESSGSGPSRLQLFHISSLATRFGESYLNVANHINAAFSRGFAKKQIQQEPGMADHLHGRTRRHKRRTQNKCPSKEGERFTSGADPAAGEPVNVSTGWEDACRLFARHINKYFGANVEDEAGDGDRVDSRPAEKSSSYNKPFPTGSTSEVGGGANPTAPPIGQTGLFHTSSNVTSFGENHFHMSNHINRYFKGPRGSEERDLQAGSDVGPVVADGPKPLSFIDRLRQPAAAIPALLGSYLRLGSMSRIKKPNPAVTPPEALLSKRLVLSQKQAEELIRELIHSLGRASTPQALIACVEALNEHLLRHPSRKALMWQEKTELVLLKKRRTYSRDEALQRAIRETLALIGYVEPVKGRGIRVLSIDGGGTRGVVPLQVLKMLEAETGKKVHQLFDYICGVSTGAVLAFMLGLARFSLEECADMYRRFGSEVFRQNRLVGTVKMGWTHSYYNTETWETILREKLGDKVLIKTARDEFSPKVSAVSAVVNWGSSPKAFVFCNYNHKPGSLSRYAGGCGYQMWQAVRASSAAPGYFQEFLLQSDIHQDGGIIMNNPCALAVHESRLLWPNRPFQCVLSLGTGRYDSARKGPATSTSLRAKISSLICSATDTEGVHTLLDDLLAPDVYFRFNPMLSAGVSLDESRPGALDQLERDTQIYLQRNWPKLARLCLVLGAERSAAGRTKDWISERVWEMKQRWV